MTQNVAAIWMNSNNTWIAKASVDFTVDNDVRVKIPTALQSGDIPLNPRFVTIDNTLNQYPITFTDDPISFSVPAKSRQTFDIKGGADTFSLYCIGGTCTVYFTDYVLCEDYALSPGVDGGAVPLIVGNYNVPAQAASSGVLTIDVSANKTFYNALRKGDLLVFHATLRFTSAAYINLNLYGSSMFNNGTFLIGRATQQRGAAPSDYVVSDVRGIIYDGGTSIFGNLFTYALSAGQWDAIMVSVYAIRNVDPINPVQGDFAQIQSVATSASTGKLVPDGNARLYMSHLSYIGTAGVVENTLVENDNSIGNYNSETTTYNTRQSGVGTIGNVMWQNTRYRLMRGKVSAGWDLSYNLTAGVFYMAAGVMYSVRGFGNFG